MNQSINKKNTLPQGFFCLAISISLLFFSYCNFDDSDNTTKLSFLELIPSQKSGINFSNDITEDHQNFFLEFNYIYDGAGVAVGDINNDGLPDIFFVGNQVSNKLYLNKGNFEFEDITQSAGVDVGGGWHNGVVMIDINNDGYQDIYVTRGGWNDTEEERKNLLFINHRDQTFIEQSAEYGLDEGGYSLHASFFDLDNDGDLDVYITNRPESFFIPIPEVIKGKRNPDDLSRDKLYINEEGTFTEVGLKSGITENFGFALSVVTADINDDGYSDIFVANDFLENDYLYINQKDGTFKESIRTATNHTSFHSMGTDIVDINNDGLEDIIVSEMLPEDVIRSKTSMAYMTREDYRGIIDNGFHHKYMHNVLHLNQGNGYFSEIAQLAGISKTDWSWTVLGSDFTNDGYRDLFISNGLMRDVNNRDAEASGVKIVQENAHRFSSQEELIRGLATDLINQYPKNSLPNYIFKNNGNLTFTNKSSEWGFDKASISHGAAVADFDNDGTMDLVVNNMDGKAFLYKNNVNQILGNNYLRIKLDGPPNNIDGLGAKIKLKYGNNEQFFQMKTTRGYLSSSEPIAHFGLDTVATIDTLMVTWHDKKQNIFLNINTNQFLEISYSDAIQVKTKKQNINPIFTDVTNQWFNSPYIHQENEFDDYQHQSLLPHSLSTGGPFITIGDVNGNGLEDFYIGGAHSRSGQLFMQNEEGKFDRKHVPAFESDKDFEDMGVLFFDADGDQSLDLYVVSGGSEFPRNSSMYQDRLYINDGEGNFTRSLNLPEINTSGSCVVSIDYDGNGYSDLFIGGRLVPEAYPFPAKSYLLRNEGGKFKDVTEEIAPMFKDLGMVTSAVWTDIDQSDDAELVVVGEWMPIRIFKFLDEKFKEVTSDLKIPTNSTKGWWNSIISTDLDQDGSQDLITGNIGLNYRFKASPEYPFHVFADDFDNNGIFDIVLSTYHNDELISVSGKDRLEQQIPGITSKFTTYHSFANANLTDIFGSALENTLHYEANNFESIILKYSDNDFYFQDLPPEAQFSAVNAILVLDYDKDGIKDLLIGGNNFNVEFKTTRADASVGLLLNGRKEGTFQALTLEESGIFIPYDVKDIKKITLGKNNTGILVGSNQDKLRLYQLTN